MNKLVEKILNMKKKYLLFSYIYEYITYEDYE